MYSLYLLQIPKNNVANNIIALKDELKAIWRSRLQYWLLSPGVDLLQTSTRDQEARDRDSSSLEKRDIPEMILLQFYIEFLILC